MSERPGTRGRGGETPESPISASERTKGLAFLEVQEASHLVGYLNKARQDSREARNVYRYVMGLDEKRPASAPDGLKPRPDLKDTFDLGKLVDGKKYNKEAEAAHDLIEHLANEAEGNIRKKEAEYLSGGSSPKPEAASSTPAPEALASTGANSTEDQPTSTRSALLDGVARRIQMSRSPYKPGEIVNPQGEVVDKEGNVVRRIEDTKSPYKQGEVVNPQGEVVDKDGNVVRRVEETKPLVDERSKEIGPEHPLREPKTEAHLESERIAAERAGAQLLRINASIKALESWRGSAEERTVEIQQLTKLLEWLNKARQDSREARNVYRYVMGLDKKKPEGAPARLEVRADLKDLFDFGMIAEGKQYNDEAEAAHDLIEHLVNEATKKKELLEAMAEEEATARGGGLENVLLKGRGLENVPMDDLRKAYLKLRHLNGLIIRRGKVEVGGMEFRAGGPKEQALKDLETLREAYNNKLSQEREAELLAYVKAQGLDTVKELSDAQRVELTTLLINQQKSEQAKVDGAVGEMGNKNVYQRFRRWWKNFGSVGDSALAKVGSGLATRVGLGFGLAAVGATGGLLGVGALGVRTGMTMTGTYLAAEGLLERWKWTGLSQKGEFNKIAKAADGKSSDEKRLYIKGLDRVAVREEVARLRALQIDKMISLESAGILRGGIIRRNVYKQDRETLQMLIDRDYEIAAELAVSEGPKESKEMQLAAAMSSYMSLDNSEILKHSEVRTQEERWKKLGRKLTAIVFAFTAGALVNWEKILGSSHPPKPVTGPTPTPPSPEAVPPPVVPESVFTVTPPAPENWNIPVGDGGNLWRIIEAKLGNLGGTDVLGQFHAEGAQTHLIDIFKDKFAAMSPAEVRGVGISSGDIDVLRSGDVIDLSKVLGDNALVAEAVKRTADLPPSLIHAIEANNHTINVWHAAHQGVFLDSETIQKVLETNGSYQP